MSSESFVLVTGVSGFLGAHVVDQLVKGGSAVRGTVRSAKVDKVQRGFDVAYGERRVDVVAIDDLAGGDFTPALKDITAVIHVASPVSDVADAEATLNSAIEGTLNVLRQAQKAGITKFSVVSSMLAVVDLGSASQGKNLTENDWNNVTRQEALDKGMNNLFVYSASKALAEKAAWEFVKTHPEVNLTTLNPAFFIGPHAPGQNITPGDTYALSTNLVLYNLILPESKLTTPMLGFVDVRDVAAGLVAGIRTPGKNRVLLASEWFDVKDAVDHISSVRPELKGRLPTLVPGGQTAAVIDSSRAVRVLGVSPVRDWRDSVTETIDYLVKLEKEWKSSGVDLDNTLRSSYWRA
jgi:nucleoside-diphosphate-sugar epimerase